MEQRECPRAVSAAAAEAKERGGVLEDYPVTLVTRDISSPECFSSAKGSGKGNRNELDIVLVAVR